MTAAYRGLGDRPPVPVQLVVILAAYRERGFSFQLAFDLALRDIRYPWDQAHEWREVLRWAKPELRACYYGAPTSTEGAMANLGARVDAELAEVEQPGARVA